MEYVKFKETVAVIRITAKGYKKRVVFFGDEIVTKRELFRKMLFDHDHTVDAWLHMTNCATLIDISRRETYRSQGVRYAAATAFDRYTRTYVARTTFHY